MKLQVLFTIVAYVAGVYSVVAFKDVEAGVRALALFGLAVLSIGSFITYNINQPNSNV